MAKEIDKMLNAKELAEATGVSERYIRTARTKYGLKYYELDEVKFKLSDWNKFLEERAHQVGRVG